MLFFPGIQFAVSDASVALDTDADAAAASARKKVLAFAAGEKLRVAGIHLDFPTFGHVAHSGSTYRFIPDVWCPTV
jgi:hypothetical protein